MNGTFRSTHPRIFSLFAVVVMLAVLFAPVVSPDDSDGAQPYYSYTINTNAEIISGTYTPIGSSSEGPYISSNGENVGSWGFDSKGYGPFNSFYAAFAITNDNRMICHLDPNDLTKSIDGTSINVSLYNIMWCLPTVYWSTDEGGNLVLSNDPSKGTAYAHTINGKVYNYIGIGVYEASRGTLDGEPQLRSVSGFSPVTNYTRSDLRSIANDNVVNTLGEGKNGHAMLWNFYQWQLYKYCAIAVMGSWDSQGVAGNGAVCNYSYNKTGLLDASGPYAGSRGDTSMDEYVDEPVKVFIENAWGNYGEFIDGIVVMNQTLVVDSNSVPTNATVEGTNVTVYADALPSRSGTGNGSSTEAGVWGIPTSTSGTTSLYDRFETSGSDNCLMYVSGSYSDIPGTGSYYGLNYINVQKSMSFKSSSVGSRLAFVFDDDIKSSVNVTFNSMGSAIQTQTIDPGTTAVSFNPELDGYTFKGWYTDNTFSTPFDFSTPITQDITLFAKWEGNFAFTSEPTADGNVTLLPSMDGTVIFDASASQGSLIVWDFGDGTTATGMYQTHYYSQPGDYVVKLMVYNDDGKVDVKEYGVSIPDQSTGAIGPNIISTIAVALVLIMGGGLIVRRLL